MKTIQVPTALTLIGALSLGAAFATKSSTDLHNHNEANGLFLQVTAANGYASSNVHTNSVSTVCCLVASGLAAGVLTQLADLS